jgi:hypothetical protein
VPVVVEYEWFFPAGVFFLVGGLGVVFLVFGLVALLVGGLGGFALALSIDTNDENSEWDMGLLLSGGRPSRLRLPTGFCIAFVILGSMRFLFPSKARRALCLYTAFVLTICCMGMRTFTLYPNRCNGPGLSLTA